MERQEYSITLFGSLYFTGLVLIPSIVVVIVLKNITSVPPFVIWTILSLFTLILYLVFLENFGVVRFANLPWKDVWPFFFTLIYGPVWWLAMSGSAIRRGRDYRRVPRRRTEEDVIQNFRQTAHGNITLDITPVPETTDNTEPDTKPPKPPQYSKYSSSPHSAQAVYLDIRQEGTKRNREQEHQRVCEKIEQGRKNLQSLAEQVKSQQSDINALASREQALKQAIEETKGEKLKADLENEFHRIMALPGVLAVQVVNNRIRLIVRALCEYEDTEYDLGDWQIELGADTLKIHATELRSGVKPDWNRDYPVYRNFGGFCFGDRQKIIDQHIAKTQYVEALALAVECLSSINPGDRKLIPGAFKIYKGEKVA